MNHKREKDEHIERLYYTKEDGTDLIAALKSTMNEHYDAVIIDELSSEDMVQLSQDSNAIVLTEKGYGYARQLIRAHRLAERLLFDVLGGDFESGACEFEHTVTGELVDSICILLGHPKTCPHGSLIPQGQCCKESCRTAQSSVVPKKFNDNMSLKELCDLYLKHQELKVQANVTLPQDTTMNKSTV